MLGITLSHKCLLQITHGQTRMEVLEPGSDDASGSDTDATDEEVPEWDFIIPDDTADELVCPRCSRMFVNPGSLAKHAVACAAVPAAMRPTVCGTSVDSVSSSTVDTEYRDLCARSLSGLLAKDGVTDSTLCAFKKTADTLHQARMRQLSSSLQDELERSGTVDPKALLERFNTLWPEMATTKQQRLVMKSVLDIVCPVKRSLGRFRHKVRVSKGKFRMVESEHHVIEFPLAEVLEAILQHECICNGIDAFREEFLKTKSPAGVIRSFYDGEVYLKHRPLAKLYPDAFALISYGDGVTLTDPCSAFKAHKVQMNYWALLELPPALQGLSELVFVSSICWTTTLKVAGPKRVFGGELKGPQDHLSFGSQLRLLAHGQLMNTSFERSPSRVVRAFLHVHAADTPEANVSAGKMETCTNTKHFCRLCFAQQDERLMPEGTVGFVTAQEGKGACGYRLRNPTDDAAQHSSVKAGAPGQPHGISNSLRGDTMFEDALSRRDFESCRDVPTDGMHIGPEGVLATEFRRYLWWVSHVTGSSPTSIDELIHSFPYHACEKSNPMPPLQATVFLGKAFNPAKKLKCTAAQAAHLARNIVQIFLPLMEEHGLLKTPQWMSLVSLCS